MTATNSFIKKIEDAFESKNISSSSVKTYLRCLKLLNNKEPLKNLNFLSDEKKILDIINQKKPNTKRNYLIAICSVAKHIDNKKIYKMYFDKMMGINKELQKEENLNEKTETQEKNWISLDEIEKKRKELEEYILTFFSKKKKDKMTKESYDKLLQFIVISLYTQTKPRRNKDYQCMILQNKITNEDDKNLNYLIYNDRKFIFNNFKTSKKEGSKIIDIPNNLFESINLYLKHHPLLKSLKSIPKDTYFLVNYEGKPLSKLNDITLILNNALGKKCSSSMIRHIYLSETYGDTLKKMKEDCANMSHSLGMQKNYIKK